MRETLLRENEKKLLQICINKKSGFSAIFLEDSLYL